MMGTGGASLSAGKSLRAFYPLIYTVTRCKYVRIRVAIL